MRRLRCFELWALEIISSPECYSFSYCSEIYRPFDWLEQRRIYAERSTRRGAMKFSHNYAILEYTRATSRLSATAALRCRTARYDIATLPLICRAMIGDARRTAITDELERAAWLARTRPRLPLVSARSTLLKIAISALPPLRRLLRRLRELPFSRVSNRAYDDHSALARAEFRHHVASVTE